MNNNLLEVNMLKLNEENINKNKNISYGIS